MLPISFFRSKEASPLLHGDLRFSKMNVDRTETGLKNRIIRFILSSEAWPKRSLAF
jgi:hypothetical protein